MQKTINITLGCVISVHAKTTRSFVCHLVNKERKRKKPRAGLDLDRDFFIPVLSAAIAVVLHWADMMPSHSMDLPVPRGTSMLMQDGKLTPNGTKTELQTCPVCITCSKYVWMSNSCFSPDGKFPFCFFSQDMCHFFWILCALWVSWWNWILWFLF